jgi:hypothetical protein
MVPKNPLFKKKFKKKDFLSAKDLKRDQSNDTKFNPPFFSLVNTFNICKQEIDFAVSQTGQETSFN